jgi:serine/threonine protein kinase
LFFSFLDIVHGDIKPENILVFGELILVLGELKKRLTAKLTDLGYSCFATNDDDIVRPPYSRIWAAPEYHHRGCTFREAKKLDVFAFGMTVVYLLFQKRVWDYFISTERPEKISSLKQGPLLERAKKVILECSHFDSQRASSLCRFMSRSLSPMPEDREESVENLIDILMQVRSVPL